MKKYVENFLFYFFPFFLSIFILYLQDIKNHFELSSLISSLFGQTMGLLFFLWLFTRKKWKNEKYKYRKALCWLFFLSCAMYAQKEYRKKQEFRKSFSTLKSIAETEIDKTKEDEEKINVIQENETNAAFKFVNEFARYIVLLKNNFEPQQESLLKALGIDKDSFNFDVIFFNNPTESNRILIDLINLENNSKDTYFKFLDNQIAKANFLKQINEDKKKEFEIILIELKEQFSKINYKNQICIKFFQELQKLLYFITHCKEESSVSLDIEDNSLIFEDLSAHTEYLKIRTFINEALQLCVKYEQERTETIKEFIKKFD